MPAFILKELCRGCKHCINSCPEAAITMCSHLAVVNPEKCIECEACLETCMHGAITLTEKKNTNDIEVQAQCQYLKQDLLLQLGEVERKLNDLKARWPFHSVQPGMVAEREDLEEDRARLLKNINSLQ